MISRDLRTSVAVAIKVGIAVGITVLALPFDARAEQHPAETTTPLRFTDEETPIEAVEAGPDDALLEACPIDGDSTFENSWGWRRSGGRSHQGVDMIASNGTPILAVRDGHAEFKRSGLGGRAVWLTTDDGDKFYYAHLSDWEGESRSVNAGEVIGYVGSSGNAGGPHLHFETRPDGHAENPYPHTLRACVPPPEPVIDEIAAPRTVWGPSPSATAALRRVADSADTQSGGTFGV